MDQLPPQAQLMNLITGKFITQALGVAVELQVADHLKAGPVAAAEVARRANAHPQATYRLLRALSLVGVLAEHEDQKFSLTPVGELLRSDAPASLAAMAKFMSRDWHSTAWFELGECVRKGVPGF